MSYLESVQSGTDNVGQQFGLDQNWAKPMVDMANPNEVQGLVRPLDGQSQSAVSPDGKLVFDNPYGSSVSNGWQGQWNNPNDGSQGGGKWQGLSASDSSAAPTPVETGTTTSANINPTTIADPLVEQLAQSGDPTLAGTLVDASSQLSPQGYEQLEQFIGQNYSGSANDNQLMDQALTQAGLNPSDASALQNVLQTDMPQALSSGDGTGAGSESTGAGSDATGAGSDATGAGSDSGSSTSQTGTANFDQQLLAQLQQIGQELQQLTTEISALLGNSENGSETASSGDGGETTSATTGNTGSDTPPASTVSSGGDTPTSTTGTTSGDAPTSTTATTSGDVPTSPTATTSGDVPTSTIATTSGDAPTSATGTTGADTPTSTTGTTSGDAPTGTTSTTGGDTPPPTSGTTSGDGSGTAPASGNDSGSTSGSGFQIQNGQLLINGQLLNGVATTGQYAEQERPQALANQISTEFPGINVVRLATSPDGGAFTQGDQSGTGYTLPGDETIQNIEQTVQALNAKGIGVIIDNHASDANTPNNVTEDGNEDAWFAQLATAEMGNNMVMFQPENEPTGPDAAIQQEQQSAYNAIRGTGSNAIVAFDLTGGWDSSSITGNAAAYDQDSNYVIDAHAYEGAASDPAADIQNEVSSVSSMTEANGSAVPVYIGEAGNSTSYPNIDQNATANMNAAWSDGTGAVAWLYAPGFGTGDADLLSNQDGSLTSYGQEVAALIANGAH